MRLARGDKLKDELRSRAAALMLALNPPRLVDKEVGRGSVDPFEGDLSGSSDKQVET